MKKNSFEGPKPVRSLPVVRDEDSLSKSSERQALPTDLDEVFAAFEARTNLEKGLPPGNPNRVYRLDRMRVLCGAFGDPQERCRTVHIAGSKGKGSVASYMAALLHAAGRRVGVYGSPHLVDYRERFRIEGEAFPEEAALSVGRTLLKKLPEVESNLAGEGGATTFELLTLFAFLLFNECGCDTVVLETGLGGRLDATNIILRPEAVFFTPIEKEHTEILGRTLSQIAQEKAGILKAGTRAWSARQNPAAMRVFRRSARKMGVPLTRIDSALMSISAVHADPPSGSLSIRDTAENPPSAGAAALSTPVENPAAPAAISDAALSSAPSAPPVWKADVKQHFFTWKLFWKDGKEEIIRLRMGGRIQAENAALALLAARSLESSLSDNSSAGDVLQDIRLPGRFHWLRTSPPVIIDGAHTPHSAAALRDAFLEVVRSTAADSRPMPSPILIFGCALGKDVEGMAKELCGGRHPAFTDVIISTPGTFKRSDPPGIAEAFRRVGAAVNLIPDTAEAWSRALETAGESRPILVTGSFYLAGEIAALERQE